MGGSAVTCTTHHDACACRMESMQRALARAEQERDIARTNYRWMVEHAADQKLDGYRELAATAAKAEQERDESRMVAAGMRVVVAAARHVVTDCCDYADGCQRADSQPCVHCRLRWALDDLEGGDR